MLTRWIMRVVLQLVSHASCTIDNKLYSSIGEGFLLLVGFKEGDTNETIEKVINKIISLRIFPDENGKTNLGFLDLKKELMCISQFTLYADVKKGRRPSFVNALNPKEAAVLYDYTLDYLRKTLGEVKSGIFGADMKIEQINDGPFTVIIEK